MSLEVDHREDFPIPHEKPHEAQKEVDTYSDGKPGHRYAEAPVNDVSPPAPKYVPTRSITLLLAAALAVMTALAVVAAGVGGSIATKRKHEINDLRRQLDAANQTQIPAACSLGNSTDIASSSSNSTSTPLITDLAPIDNCTAIGDGKKYVSAWTQQSYTVHCHTDYPGGDIMGIWVFTFADCIEACASFNAHISDPHCYAVSYDTSNTGSFVEKSGLGNCFLKGSGSVQAHEKNVTSSAQAQFSGQTRF
ncbi:MAG: hypothetical protein Q9220_007581 [cf. Caloplaca sp. 1 TL-2023]